jgi:hypothetical protein
VDRVEMATVEVQCLSFTPPANSLLDSAQEVVEAVRAKLPAKRRKDFSAQVTKYMLKDFYTF